MLLTELIEVLLSSATATLHHYLKTPLRTLQPSHWSLVSCLLSPPWVASDDSPSNNLFTDTDMASA
jgi:hypothetical protein